ncbi:MAG: phytanoyl-CoA dioxygenase family protein [Capsulimonadales bacterium]|nr:phytanoyl-CoA dioxygenase family protein [Capsulimonadales bacterium]
MSAIIEGVTMEQIADFHRNGFIALGPITDAAELEWMRGVYDRIFSERAGRESGDQFDLGGTDEEGKEAVLPQILNPSRYAPELREGNYLKNADRIVKQLLGPTASVGIAHAIFKPAGTGAATPWHQDEAYWDPAHLYYSVSVWMPLQPATIDNGCLWFVPGSHRWDVLPHRSIGGDPRIHGLELAVPDPDVLLAGAVPCPLEPGGITIHLNRTLHYAGANTSDIPRRALILGAGLPSLLHPGERRFPWNEAKITPRQERAREAAGAAR